MNHTSCSFLTEKIIQHRYSKWIRMDRKLGNIFISSRGLEIILYAWYNIFDLCFFMDYFIRCGDICVKTIHYNDVAIYDNVDLYDDRVIIGYDYVLLSKESARISLMHFILGKSTDHYLLNVISEHIKINDKIIISKLLMLKYIGFDNFICSDIVNFISTKYFEFIFNGREDL